MYMRLSRSLSPIACLMVFAVIFSMATTALAAPKAKDRAGATAASIATSAESAVILDANGAILFEKNAHKRLPPASVTKIMTLLLAVEAVEQGKMKLADEVSVSHQVWRQGGSQIWLEPGEKMSVKEMMTAVAVVSANDAALAIMEHIYGNQQAAVDAMNLRAIELGLQNTHFANVNGLPIPDHYMSAYDTALIAREALKHPLYMELVGIKEHWLRNGKNWLVNTNKLLWWYPGADGLKTGWTEEAKYCFVGTAKRDGLRLIAAVFATPEPRSHLRETMKLFDWGFANFTANSVVEQFAPVQRIKISKGMDKAINAVAAESLSVISPKGKKTNMEKKISCSAWLTAPIIKGQKCGEMVALQDGKVVGKIDLIAEKDVAKAGFTKIFTDNVLELFKTTK